MCVKNNKVFIYALTEPITHEIRYIGKTNNLYERYYMHLQELQEPTKKHYHSKNWIRELFSRGYAPKIEVLETCNQSNWQEREMYWIEFYKRLGTNLTNMTKGGDGGAMLGKPSPKRMKVDIYKINGDFVQCCDSLAEAELITNVHNGKIAAICKRKRRSGKGYVFRYKGDSFEYNSKIQYNLEFMHKEVLEVDNNLTILNTFKHAQIAANFYNIDRSNISFACNHPIKQNGELRVCKNRHFVYRENYEDIVRTLEKSKTLANNHAEVHESEL